MEIQDTSNTYRKYIDGLRAIAVVAVILFHFGYLPNGYLGVDVFFVISGYLITKIIYDQINNATYSLTQFYLRRLRRIIPLVLLISTVALAVGYFVMLPDDLENLSESIIATNFFGNNILQYLTVGSYWSASTHYMPLMHTWSLGVEEQFYLAYPLLFLLFKNKQKLLLPVLICFTIVSIVIFISASNSLFVFYLLPARFFELALGGIVALVLNGKTITTPLKSLIVILLCILLFVPLPISSGIKLGLVVILSVFIVAFQDTEKLSGYLLENRLMVFLGKISFSLYMWHQVVLAFTRYFITDSYSYLQAALIAIVIIGLSIISYYRIEQPFRNVNKISNKVLLLTTGSIFTVLTAISFYIYISAGVIRDVPELDLNTRTTSKNIHSTYNDRIYKLDNNFKSNNKIKVLIIGHSFARDWANVILASKYKDEVDISYTFALEKALHPQQRLDEADYIYFSHLTRDAYNILAGKYAIDNRKVKIIGLKNFGVNNGIFYNRRGAANYCDQRVNPKQIFFENNDSFIEQWGEQYIDIIGRVADKNKALPVFTPNCKFISQDGKHFTPAGAAYFAKLFEGTPALHFEE